MRQLLHDRPFFARLTFALLLVLAATFAHSQVPVGMAPPLHFQFLTQSGEPLASGKIFTYAAGTTTPLNTYVDATGTVQNTDPIVLDATGSPSNGTVETGIFLANLSYKFMAYNSANVLQWSVDNVSTYFGLLNSNNVWTGTNTFALPITITPTDNQIVLGAPGNQMTLDFPPPTGNQTLHFANTSDTVVARNTTDTMTNKTLVAPVITNPTINSCPMPNGISTCLVLQSGGPGTVLNTLTKIVHTGGVSSFQIAGLTDTSGILGITVANAGVSGFTQVQTSGYVSCVFDGATGDGNYVQISSTVLGNCHDTGIAPPNAPPAGQVIGRVLQSAGVAGTYIIELYGPEIQSRGLLYTTASTPATTSIGPFTMATAGSGGNTYRFSFYADQTVLGNSCSTNSTISVLLTFTDPNTSASPISFPVLTIINNGTVGAIAVSGGTNIGTGQQLIRAKASTTVSYSATYVPGSCTGAPTYQIYPILEQLN